MEHCQGNYFLALYVCDAHCRHLANMTELSVRGGDAALCQMTLTTCYGHRAKQIILYIIHTYTLYFLPGFFFFFSSSNLSHHRLDVCHTSTHGVALVPI